MWNLCKSEVLDGYLFVVRKNDKVISYRDVLELLKSDEDFRGFFIASLQELSFESFRWETPGYTEGTLDQEFEFVVLNDPSINRKANSKPFESFISDTDKTVVSFQSLGKDAHLVVPSCQNQAANYCHLASFTSTAPISQQQDLWSLVGNVGLELASNIPVWLSTAGGGVAWLHVRFDTEPKYYHYAKFKQSPNK
ncbi:DUF6940 family protein [Microbulbifer sp. CnH-101-G]|uniref:DUF6940 family protein n=1 Tax=Microbulbifer sp. CnH-101-G TaxID=3243393 RepID=UPI0040397F7B